MMDVRFCAKLSFIFCFVGFEVFILPSINLHSGADDYSVSFTVLFTISFVLNYVTYQESFTVQPIAMILSISFLIATALYMFIIFLIECNINFSNRPYSFVYLLSSSLLAVLSTIFKIIQFVH
ncbi:hypothetical protein HELRODRAFT_162065 [Helobdella robusta]|uniref:Uncharacterized protein n=1 Tax=Helobdella robusta TaxID=6412 RepID=T1ES77_HELRO|nr:hypothetical protein HELRODRAFT_162065 [Helobdella robusta]ESN98628.1 hypothetical protein HELRODRAFT_162065 [Helobdella robusta]